MNYISSDIISGLQSARTKNEEDISSYRNVLANLDGDKASEIKKLRDDYASRVSDLNSLYEDEVISLKSKIRDSQLSVLNIDRALSSLTNVEKTTLPTSVQKDEAKVPSEVIYDAIISHLFINKQGTTLKGLSDLLKSKNMLDESKSLNALMGSLIGNMTRLGYIERRNSLYVLPDDQDAIERTKARKFILDVLSQNGNMSVSYVQKAMQENNVPGHTDKRRVRGILLGMSMGKYVDCLTQNNEEVYCASNS